MFVVITLHVKGISLSKVPLKLKDTMGLLSNVINVVQTWSLNRAVLVSILAVTTKSVKIRVSYLKTAKLHHQKKILCTYLNLNVKSQKLILFYVTGLQVFSWRLTLSLNHARRERLKWLS